MLNTRVKYHNQCRLLNNQQRLKKNEGQEGKTGPVWGWVSVGVGRVKERVKEDKYN
jgi:hypothetical protein